jgi:alpha-galactosidase
MLALSIHGATLNPRDLLCKVFDRQGNSDHMEVCIASTGLRWGSDWLWNEKEAILSRRDTLINDSEKPRSIPQIAMRFGLAPDRYDLWVQTSSWAHENQLQKAGFNGGRLSLASQGGRTLQGGAPYLYVTQIETGLSLAFHLLPRGDWEISCDQSRHAGDVSRPFTTLELGPKAEGFDLLLHPGEAFLLPECWIEAAEGDQPEQAAPALQRHALHTLFNGRRPGFKKTAPIVYNTWFDAFDALEPHRLRQQLAAAIKAGCEVFVVDAGWYGNGAGGWHEQVGDWQEKTDTAFKGKMSEFADEVRAAAMGFGLRVEPERY